MGEREQHYHWIELHFQAMEFFGEGAPRKREGERYDREIEKENAVGISFASFSLDSRNMFR